MRGSVAIVTGAAGHIGGAIAVALGGREATLVLLDRVDPAERWAALRASGITADGYRCDVTDSAAVDAAISAVLDRHGRIDILVNCAGGAIRGGLVETSDAEWRAQLDGNLSGAFHLMRACLPSMLAQGSGSIVNVASISGVIGGLPSSGAVGRSGPAYAAAKAGLIGLTKWAAREYGRQGVRVNAIAPGPVRTHAGNHGYDYGTGAYPIPRMGTVEDMAEAVVFLASPAASYITGEVLKVSGGIGM